MKNKSVQNPVEWTEEYEGMTLKFQELICQSYSNCKFSAGVVEGHPVDTVYIRAEKDGVLTTDMLLRPDELASIAWCATGAIWSVLLEGDKK